MMEEGSEEPGTIVINSDVIVKQEVNFEQEDPGPLYIYYFCMNLNKIAFLAFYAQQ